MKIHYQIRIFLNILMLIFDVAKVIILLFNKKNYKIFIQLEGGFGHNISEPHYLNITEKEMWILILALDKKFHNPKVKEIFYPHIISVNKTSLYWTRTKEIENFYIFLIKKFLLIKVLPVSNYIMSHNYEVKKNNYHKCLESREFIKFFNYRNHNIYKNYLDQISSNNIFNKIIHSNSKGIINFQFRAKAKKTLTPDKFSQFRDSENIDNFKPSIEAIVEKGWAIVFGGEEFDIPNWFKSINDKLIYRSKTNLNRNDYGFMAGLKTDIYIGPPSGGAMFNLINSKKKSLLLNCLPFGFGLINSVVSYPIMEFKNKNQFKMIFTDYIYDRYNFELYNSLSLRKQSPDEMKDIIIDYLNNINRDYGYSNTFFDINNGIFEDTKFKVSEKWLKIINYNKLN
jgi:hypothetical protein